MSTMTRTSRMLLLLTRRSSPRLVRSRRWYHELSFQSTGEPSTVLEYRQNKSSKNDDRTRPSPQHVGVDILHAALNPADINTIQGRYPDASKDTATRRSLFYPKSTVAGSEGIGRVRHVSSTDGDHDNDGKNSLKEGDIVTVGVSSIGTMRSFLWAPAGSLIAIERGEELMQHVGPAAASTLPQLGGTALRMLSDFDGSSSGLVIQNAGNSSVGFMTSQLAHSALKRSVISIVRRGSKSEDDWQSLVDYLTVEGKCLAVVAEEDLASKEGMITFQESLKLHSPAPPTLALNAVGGASASLLAKLLGPSGSMVTYGGMSKEPVTASTPHFIFKDLRYFGYWHSRWMTNHVYEEKKKMIDFLADSVLDGGVSCPLIEEFSLSDFSEALKVDTDQSGIRRKVVFRCHEDQ